MVTRLLGRCEGCSSICYIQKDTHLCVLCCDVYDYKQSAEELARRLKWWVGYIQSADESRVN
jgi:hypothetical protein